MSSTFRSLFAALALALPSAIAATPRLGFAQSLDALPAHARIRIDVRTGERNLFHHAKTQSIIGTFIETRDDTVRLALSPDANTIGVPRALIAGASVSRGVPNRFSSAYHAAAGPTVVTAVLTAIGTAANNSPNRPSVGYNTLATAGSMAIITGSLGFLFPKERWGKLSLR